MVKAKVVNANEDKPVTKEVLAEAIVNISKAVKSLSKSGLNRQAIITLVADKSKIGKGTIEVILNNLEDLERDYCR